jgi:hypothetical protein
MPQLDLSHRMKISTHLPQRQYESAFSRCGDRIARASRGAQDKPSRLIGGEHDWEFARTGSSRFDNESKLAFVETGGRRQSEFWKFPTEKAKEGRGSSRLSGCGRMLCANRNQSHPGEVEDADSVSASAWASPLG